MELFSIGSKSKKATAGYRAKKPKKLRPIKNLTRAGKAIIDAAKVVSDNNKNGDISLTNAYAAFKKSYNAQKSKNQNSNPPEDTTTTGEATITARESAKKETPQATIQGLLEKQSSENKAVMEKQIQDLKEINVSDQEIESVMLQHTESRKALPNYAIITMEQGGEEVTDEERCGVEGNNPGDEAQEQLGNFHEEKMGAHETEQRQLKAQEAQEKKRATKQKKFNDFKKKTLHGGNIKFQSEFEKAFKESGQETQQKALENIDYLKTKRGYNDAAIIQLLTESVFDIKIVETGNMVTEEGHYEGSRFHPETQYAEMEQRTTRRPQGEILQNAVDQEQVKALKERKEEALGAENMPLHQAFSMHFDTESKNTQSEMLTAINKLTRSHKMEPEAIIKLMETQYTKIEKQSVREEAEVFGDDYTTHKEMVDVTKDVEVSYTDPARSLTEAAQKPPALPPREKAADDDLTARLAALKSSTPALPSNAKAADDDLAARLAALRPSQHSSSTMSDDALIDAFDS